MLVSRRNVRECRTLTKERVTNGIDVPEYGVCPPLRGGQQFPEPVRMRDDTAVSECDPVGGCVGNAGVSRCARENSRCSDQLEGEGRAERANPLDGQVCRSGINQDNQVGKARLSRQR